MAASLNKHKDCIFTFFFTCISLLTGIIILTGFNCCNPSTQLQQFLSMYEVVHYVLRIVYLQPCQQVPWLNQVSSIYRHSHFDRLYKKNSTASKPSSLPSICFITCSECHSLNCCFTKSLARSLAERDNHQLKVVGGIGWKQVNMYMVVL